ncbi:hypothetical protein PT2222_110173 [Paraburkholderia tropica]
MGRRFTPGRLNRGTRSAGLRRQQDGRIDAGRRGEPNQFGQRSDFHLLHDARPVDLDRFLRRTEFVGHQFVRPPGNHERHDLALTRRQRFQTVLKLRALLALLEQAVRVLDCACRGFKQHTRINRFRQEVRRARLHRVYRGLHVTVRRNKHDRHDAVQTPLQFDAAQVGQLEVEQHACGGAGQIRVVQEVAGSAISLHGVAPRSQQATQRIAYVFVVVHDEHYRSS